MKKVFQRLFVLILTSYVASAAFLYCFQDKILFHPTLLTDDYVFDLDARFSENFLELSTGDKVHYLKFPSPSSKTVVLYFHGNGGALNEWSYFAQNLHQKLNLAVWIVDYPGFGKSSKKLSKTGEGLVLMGEELLGELKKEHPDKKIVLFGRSLGSGVVSEIAKGVDGVILETPFYSVGEMAKELYPIIPTFLLKYNLDNSKLKNANVENILVLYGGSDQMIPVSHPKRLKGVYPLSAKFVEIEKGGHNDLPMYKKYWEELTIFFNQMNEI